MTNLPDVTAARPAIDIIVDSSLWRAMPEAQAVLRRAVAAAAMAASKPDAELAILLTDDSAIRELNLKWRGFDKPTNVLSFPAHRVAGAASAALGDIAIAFETVEREAAAEKKPFSDHLAHLAVHGFLHLLGYDHETDDEADVMEHLESSILAQIDVPNPYWMRNQKA